MTYKILWADDEIDLLKPYILFLEGKGYEVFTVNSGADALDLVETQKFDILFLDENMPGMSGLEVLLHIKKIRPNLPVIMITKSEEEELMEDAIGSKIADYLIKPLNPNQLLLSVKRIFDKKRLEEGKTNVTYQQEFLALSMQYQDHLNAKEWSEIYEKLIYWELEIDTTENKSMAEVLNNQKNEANAHFSKFIEKNYEGWLMNPNTETPVLSHLMLRKHVFPKINDKSPLYFILIDNLRFDQWKTLDKYIQEYFRLESESTYFSILPTTTAYARNSIFAGMMPSEIAKNYPDKWVYHKIIHQYQGKQLVDNFNKLATNDLNVIVYNFVDMLSHARTDMAMIKELAPDESAYRSLTASWFQHSPLFDLLKKIAEKKGRVIITTDHGMIRVQNPIKIVGDRNTNTNLRYKQGKNLNWDNANKMMVCRKPENIFLPKPNVSTTYVFAKEDNMFAYPNNYNQYVNHYRNTFQHGGISLEECIIPVIYYTGK